MSARAILGAALVAVALQAEAQVSAADLIHHCQAMSATASAAVDMRLSGAKRAEVLKMIRRHLSEDEVKRGRFWIETIFANPDWSADYAGGYVLGFCLGAGFAILDAKASATAPIKRRQSWEM